MPACAAASCTARVRNARSTTVATISATTIAATALTQGPVPVSATSMAAESSDVPAGPKAVLLDALGTLMSFEPPARDAMRAEIAYYRAHLHEGADAASLAALRVRCAEAMRPALPGLPVEAV